MQKFNLFSDVDQKLTQMDLRSERRYCNAEPKQHAKSGSFLGHDTNNDLEVLQEVEGTIRGNATLARLEAALDVQYADQFEKQVFQYRWALRHPVVKAAITKALVNRFPAR